jgi:hypothetical protein
MRTLESFDALRRVNPRADVHFDESVDLARVAVCTRIAAAAAREPRRSRSRLPRASLAGGTLAVAAALALLMTVRPTGPSPGVESATAAMKKAVTLTSASAERSGTAIVRITHEGKLWASSMLRWNGDDLALSSDAPRRPGHAGSALLLVGGTMYGIEQGRWVVLGSPDSIDPGSGTTPAEYLAAVREDVGGVTLRRLTDGMTGLTRRQLDDGSTVYSGSVAAGLIARKTGFKEGQMLRMLPFGYVAHDEAANPAAPLDVAVTVGADGVVREIAVSWGTRASAWRYIVTYRGLGTTPAPAAPADAKPLRQRLRAE